MTGIFRFVVVVLGIALLSQPLPAQAQNITLPNDFFVEKLRERPVQSFFYPHS